ncbi:CRISPR-associated protein Cas1 [Thermosipho melanesiensis]|uniref:CRISPR-associated endonuclease Cas1 n=2 Tax=Thermosipho melanesiensis TaxID=46541 RepID=A6LJW7_THEM4|nr:type I-B CRISPR-associated endonuclease Cas1b [Thermosipho melanesiensis]ABR30218.1 CRISPR-associated protein Cas1 [Thermosipho melanesiensis BI429]APT73414.1 CRISPR-associated protein Cas1 [Thermosipho melanesiensis]OOC37352.1 CRISPR-associated protein Cas1 [Thermosipho melanesiensis]OOC39714.1 CRISPR-associated protein Cas1 [Thermosipho melanesiensis]OOC39819.1 CRISPR-associated protein Cas1 [Thermosipho melanesiensis]
MKETVYIFSDGTLKREDNSLVFLTKDNVKKHIPVENLKEIYIFGEVNCNKRLLEFVAKKEIMISFFNYYGFYVGSFYPREHYNSGFMILKQAEHYIDKEKRLFIAKKFVEGAVKNSLKVLKYYNRRGKQLINHIHEIEESLKETNLVCNIPKLMQIEGRIKKIYYNAFNNIIESEDFNFLKRSKRPPIDRINALISFSNSLIYSIVLREIYSTHLDPRIGFLHSTNFRRFSLNLDIAEIFKPVLGDRVIFSAINKEVIGVKDFEKSLNRVFLNNNGKKKIIEMLENKLKETVKMKKIGKKVSYRTLIRMELYKLEKHFLDDEIYTSLVMEW